MNNDNLRMVVELGVLRGAAQALSDIINADENGEPYTGEGLGFALDSYNSLTKVISKTERDIEAFEEFKEAENAD